MPPGGAARAPRQASHLSWRPDRGLKRPPHAHAFSAISMRRPGGLAPALLASLLARSTARRLSAAHLAEHVAFGNTAVSKGRPHDAQALLHGGPPAGAGGRAGSHGPTSLPMAFLRPPSRLRACSLATLVAGNIAAWAAGGSNRALDTPYSPRPRAACGCQNLL
jgi:hypothetical protein